MEIGVDPLSPVPIYQQIRDRIVEAIGDGKLRRGDVLGSVRAMAGAFRINPATVVKAYELLRSESLVATNAKTGTFVARDRDGEHPGAAFEADWSQRLTTVLAEGRARGIGHDRILEFCGEICNRLESGRPMKKEGQ
jgi:GntR family transcriptional regulator